MAIASVARKATIRRDDTLFKANQLVQQQKSVAKKLEQQQQKIDADAAAQEADLNSERLKEFYKIKGGAIPQWEQENKQGMENLSNTLLDPSVSGADKDRALMAMHARAGVVEANTASLERVHESLVGTEKQRQERNEDAITKYTSGYLDVTGAQDYNETVLQEGLSNSLGTYNTGNTTKNWMGTVQDEVTKSTSTMNVAGDAFTQIDQKTKSGKFLVLNDNGIGFKIEPNGKPTVVLTGESLASYEGYSKGHSLEIDKYIEDNTRGGGSRFTPALGTVKFDDIVPTRLEAMEAILREKGAFNIQETTKTDVKVTPKDDNAPDASDKKAAAYKVSVSRRVGFLTGNPKNNMAVLTTGGRGVVANAEVVVKNEKGVFVKKPVKTGFRRENGKTIYTIVSDPNKFDPISILSTDIAGQGGVEYSMISQKEAKFQVTEIVVDDKDPRAGISALNVLYNKAHPSKLSLDTADVLAEFDRQEAEKEAAAASETTKLTPAQQAILDAQNKGKTTTPAPNSAVKLTEAQQRIVDLIEKNAGK